MTVPGPLLALAWAAFLGAVAIRLRPRRRGSAGDASRDPVRGAAVGGRRASPRPLAAVAALGSLVRRAALGRTGGASDRALGLAALVGASGLSVAPLRGAALGPLAWLVAVGLARLRRHVDADLDAVTAQLFEAVELMVVALGGGLHLRAALEEVQPWLDGRLGEELARCLARSRRGWPLADELEQLPHRLHPCARGFSSALVSAERYGAPIVPALERLAVELRSTRRRRLEERARQVPVRLLLPLVGGILPAFVLLAVVPLLVGALAGIRGGT